MPDISLSCVINKHGNFYSLHFKAELVKLEAPQKELCDWLLYSFPTCTVCTN